MGGANDFGIDVACFKSDKGFEGPWDNFQCKYYKGEPLAPSTAIPEIGKILWHIHSKKISCPENYYFFLGDNRDNSTDSRFLNKGPGYIYKDKLVGKAQFLFFSSAKYPPEITNKVETRVGVLEQNQTLRNPFFRFSTRTSYFNQ